MGARDRAAGGSEAGRDAPAGPGALSRLLGELADTPDRDVHRAWARSLAPGATVGRFEIVRELGQGGFGVVFEARDRELKRLVAFKAVRPGARTRAATESEEALLRREADAVAQLSHPNIVTLHDVGTCEDGPYLILELLRGETLAQRLQRGPLPVREAVRVALAVGEALVHAHGQGVLHRDLKPSNVFLTGDGRVKVLDFGLAHFFGAGGPAGSGTPGYMAPEQRRGGDEDARTDVFALGILLHEMLAGPRKAAGGAPPRRLEGPGAPAALGALVERMLDPDPAGRPRDAAAAVEALRRLQPSAPRRLLAVAAVGATLLLAVAAVAVLALRHATPGPIAGPAPGAPPATVEAYRHLFLGEQCAARPVWGQDCSVEFRRALELDPTLPAARLGLAVWLRWYGGTVAQQRAEIAEAMRHRDRATQGERLLIEAWAAHLDGREEDAIAAFRAIAARWPGDPRAFYELGDLLRHRDELEEAIPAFERAVALDPESAWAMADLAEALGALGRSADLRAWVKRWEALPGPAALHGVSLGRGWLGDVGGAAEAARRAVALGGTLTAQEDLLAALTFSGNYAEVVEASRPLAQRGSPVRRIGYYALAGMDAYQGRRRAGLAQLDALRREVPETATESVYLGIRADYVLGDGDAPAVWAEARALQSLDPRAAADLAPSLAWLGDLPHAAELARSLRAGSLQAETHAAVAAHRRGDPAALDRLRAVAERTPITTWRVAPLFLYGDLAARAGRDADAVRALERVEALYVPRTMWRTWAHARALLLLAGAYERLGDREKARGAAGRFLAEWTRADPADPLLAEGRAVARRVGLR
ncbi:MAG TPA: serine/threonine-protein kinase [Anaeromyxobacteraceae bacterium]|nr:serine/threonine-protein kinase [Anaeromyxobacteraceae bacterium]